MSEPITNYFGDRADVYARHRPDYAPAALAYALEGLAPPLATADVGAGTGISTRALAARVCGAGGTVVGVEPNDAMRAEAERAGGPAGLRYAAGTGEATGLPAASLDLVVCAQAFHWFDAPRALAELRRVLHPGGRLALLWNVRDEQEPFMAALEQVIAAARADAQARGRVVHASREAEPGDGGHFAAVERASFQNPVELDRAGLVGRIASASYFPASGALRAELVRRLEAAHAAHAVDGRVTFLQVTEVTRARAAGDARSANP